MGFPYVWVKLSPAVLLISAVVIVCLLGYCLILQNICLHQCANKCLHRCREEDGLPTYDEAVQQAEGGPIAVVVDAPNNPTPSPPPPPSPQLYGENEHVYEEMGGGDVEMSVLPTPPPPPPYGFYPIQTLHPPHFFIDAHSSGSTTPSSNALEVIQTLGEEDGAFQETGK